MLLTNFLLKNVENTRSFTPNVRTMNMFSKSRFLKGNKRVWEKSLPVYLQVDEQVPYKVLIDVMLIFKNSGFRQVGLVIKQDF